MFLTGVFINFIVPQAFSSSVMCCLDKFVVKHLNISLLIFGFVDTFLRNGQPSCDSAGSPIFS